MIMSTGMIHIACYCGAALFCIGDTPSGQPIEDIIEQLKKKLGPGDIGFFTSANGQYGDCPYCGLTYELPEPEMLDWLPYMDSDRISSAIKEMRSAKINRNINQQDSISARRSIL